MGTLTAPVGASANSTSDAGGKLDLSLGVPWPPAPFTRAPGHSSVEAAFELDVQIDHGRGLARCNKPTDDGCNPTCASACTSKA